MKRIVKGAQIGVHFFRQVARQEPQLFTGLNRGAGQHDADAVVVHQSGHRHGHGQVGLASARGADPKDDVMVTDGLNVALLVEAFGGDAPLYDGNVNRIQEDVLDRGALLVLENLDGILHILRQDRIPRLEQAVEFLKHALGQAHVGLGSLQGHLIAPDVVLHSQAAADNG